jgi:hypothetical protein
MKLFHFQVNGCFQETRERKTEYLRINNVEILFICVGRKYNESTKS